MQFWRILVVATGAQLVGVGAIAAFVGLGGAGVFGRFWSGWLDLANTFAPIWFVLCFVGALMVWRTLEPRRARTTVLAVGLAGMLVSGLPIAGEVLLGGRNKASPGRGDKTLKVLTFNAFDENFMPSQAIAAILASGADVAAIQEPRDLRPLLPQLRRVYPYQSACDDDACRIVILARRRPLAMQTLLLPGGGLGGVTGPTDGDVPAVRIDFVAPDGHPATLVSTHFGWPVPPLPYRRQQAVLEQYIAGIHTDRLILTGDFNMTPWTFAMHRQDAALRPLHRLTRAMPTWPAYVPRLYIPLSIQLLPIDHIYVGTGWRPVRVVRLPRAASDHLPVLAELSAARPRS